MPDRRGRVKAKDVADETSAVTDTHPLINHASGGRRLGSRAAAHFEACERRRAITYVPMAVVWETSVLVRSWKVNLHRSVEAFFADLFSNSAYQPLDLSLDQVLTADGLRLNRDPFDALIVAAALAADLPLITRDTEITQSGAVQVWW